MIPKPESGISPIISVILLIFLTMVLIGGAALVLFGFTDDLADEKQVYLTAEVTGNITQPLIIQMWKIGDGPKLKELFCFSKYPHRHIHRDTGPGAGNFF